MIISLEGNIGSGKSTFYNYIKEHFSRYYNRPEGKCIHFVEEPVGSTVEGWATPAEFVP